MERQIHTSIMVDFPYIETYEKNDLRMMIKKPIVNTAKSIIFHQTERFKQEYEAGPNLNQ